MISDRAQAMIANMERAVAELKRRDELMAIEYAAQRKSDEVINEALRFMADNTTSQAQHDRAKDALRFRGIE